MNDKRYFDLILKTEIAQLSEVLQLLEKHNNENNNRDFSEVIKDLIKEKVAALPHQ